MTDDTDAKRRKREAHSRAATQMHARKRKYKAGPDRSEAESSTANTNAASNNNAVVSAQRPRAAPPMFNADELKARLRAYDRTPFLDVLALFLECTPSEEDIRAFARRDTRGFVQAISSLGGVAGFSQKTEINNNVNVNVTRMSDSQIEDKLDELMAELQTQKVERAQTAVGLPTIDIDPSEQSSDP